MLKVDIKHKNLEFNFTFNSREVVAIVGESGSGKTTLLRVIAGLEKAVGKIVLDKQTWLNNKSSLAPQKRSIGFVMQDYALFENMSVLDNLLYVNNDLELANRVLKIVALENFIHRSPKTLSGGQKQRVALARAIVAKPKILLLDEPLSAIDSKMRVKLQEYILKFHKEFNLTTILVSHDLKEVSKLANRVITLSNGKVQKVEDNNKEQSFIKAVVLDKIIDSNRYELIVDLLGDIKRFSVKEDIFNSKNIGEQIDINWSIK